MNDALEKELQFEKLRDTAERFVAEQYESNGFYMHFHRNPELYCVIKGEVHVTVRGGGTECTLTEGQMAFISGLESHSYDVEKPATIAYFHIGTGYIEPFLSLYKDKAPEHWLTDAAFNNEQLYPIVRAVIDQGASMSTLERVSYANLLLARIVNKYGVNENRTFFVGEDKISDIIQYIYDNSDADLSLKLLAEKFGYVPKVLSRKMAAYIDVDLRVFINDIRAQKVMMMRNDKQFSQLSLLEIASRCGFNSVATFYRSYNRNFHHTPLPDKT